MRKSGLPRTRCKSLSRPRMREDARSKKLRYGLQRLDEARLSSLGAIRNILRRATLTVDAILQIIEENGVYERAPGGAVKIFFGKREHRMVVERLKRFIQLADKAKGGTIILDNNKVLTVYKRS